MPSCPSCQIEYRSGFTRCSDCDAELVDSLPQQDSSEISQGDLELVEMGTFPSPLHAQMIQELLENNGIASILQSDANGGVAFGAIPQTLLVRNFDLPKARELYEQFFEGDQPEQELEPGIDDQDQVEP